MDPDAFGPKVPGQLISIGDESHEVAFVPDSLPPEVDANELLNPLANAVDAVGELKGIGPRVGNSRTLIEAFVRKEALESSRIEGTRATLSDLYAFEAGEEQLVQERNREGVREVENYLRALETGLERIEADERITTNLVHELHEILLADVRGDGKRPGDYRTGQVYIGGSPFIEEARYVPPPAERVPDLMDDLLTYVNRDDDLHPLLRIGLVHYQFETIHPFFDGNGRLGRLLISLLFQRDGVLPEPYLYLSSFFNAYKQAYADRMLAISQTGEWERWIKFFLEGLRVQAVEARKRANILVDLREEYREQYQRHRSTHILPLIMHLFERPYLDVNHAADRLDVDYSTAHRLVKQLQEDGVLEEITGRDRNRFYRGTRIFEAINEPIDVDE